MAVEVVNRLISQFIAEGGLTDGSTRLELKKTGEQVVKTEGQVRKLGKAFQESSAGISKAMQDQMRAMAGVTQQQADAIAQTGRLAAAEAKQIATEKKLVEIERKLAEALKRRGQETLSGAQKLTLLSRQEELALRIARKHGTEIQATRRAVKAFGSDLTAAGRDAGKYAGRLGAAQKEVRQLAAAQRKAAGASGGLSQALRKQTASIAGLVVGYLGIRQALRGIAAAAGIFTNLEDELLGTKAVTGATASQMARLEEQTRALGASTPRTAVEVAGLQQELARAGFSINETLVSSKQLIAFASAGQLDLAEATGVSATILRAFDADVSELSRITDVLATSASSAKTDITQLSEGMKFASSAAASLDESVEQTSAALAVIQERGLQGGLAGRGLRTVFKGLAVETDKATAVLGELGLKFSDVNLEMNDLLPVIQLLAERNINFGQSVRLVGTEGTAALLNLTRGAEKFGEITTKNMDESAGATLRMARIMESGLGGATRELRSATEGVAISLAEGMSPALNSTAADLTVFLQTNQAAAEQLGEGLAVATTAAGKALLVVGAGVVLLTDNSDLLLAALVAVAAFMAGPYVASASAAAASQTSLVIVTNAATAAFARLNVTMLANPFGLVAVGIVAVLAILNGGFRRSIEQSDAAIRRMTAGNDKLIESHQRLTRTLATGNLSTVREDLKESSIEVLKLSRDLAVLEKAFSESFLVEQRIQIQEQIDDVNAALQRTTRETQLLTKRETELAKVEDDRLQMALKKFDQTKIQTNAEIASAAAVKKIEEATKGVNDQIAKLGLQADIMRELGVGIETAGEAAALVLASGMELSRDRALEFVEVLRVANELVLEISKKQAFPLPTIPRELPLIRPSLGPVTTGMTTDQINRAELEAAKNRRREREAEFDRGLASAEEQRELLASAQDQARQDMSRGFDAIAGTLSLFNSDLGNIVGQILNIVEQVRGGGAAGGGGAAAGAAAQAIGGGGGFFGGGGAGGGGGGGAGAGGALTAGIAAAAPMIAAFVAVFDLVSAHLERKAARRFGIPISTVTEGGVRSGVAIGSTLGAAGAIDAVNAMNDAIDRFRVSIGATLIDLDEIGISVRKDGEEFQLTIAGTVFGIFDSFEGAWEEGLRVAARTATFEGIGPLLAQALSRIPAGRTLEDFEKLIPILREMDDVNAGLSVSYSAAKLAADQFLVQLDVTSEALQAHGIGLEDITKWRLRELAAQKEQALAAGAALAGVSSNLAQFEQWAASIMALQDAQEAQAQWMDTRIQTIAANTGPTIVRPGRPGIEGGIIEGGLTIVGDAAQETTSDLEELGAAIGLVGAEAVGGVADFVELVRESVAAQGELGFLQELAGFQERFGVQLVNNSELQRRMAELDFRIGQIRITLAVRELEVNALALGLTEQQLNVWRGIAAEVQGLEFDFSKVSRGGGGGGGGGRRQERIQAAEEFRQAAADIAAELAGATPVQIAYADAEARLVELRQAGKVSLEELGVAIQGLAELGLRDIGAEWMEASLQFRESDLGTSIREATERAMADLADAAVFAAERPGLFAGVSAAIEQGLRDELREIARDALAAVSGPLVALRFEARETEKAIRDLIENADVLGLTFDEIGRGVKNRVVPELLDLIRVQAERVGDASLLADVEKRSGEFQLILARAQFELLVAQLQIVGPIGAGLQSILDRGRELFALADDARRAADAGDPFAGSAVAITRVSPRVSRGGGGGAGAATRSADALARALENVARQTETWLDAGIDPLTSKLDGMVDQFATLRDAVVAAGGSVADLAELENALSFARQAAFDDALKGVRDFLAVAERQDPALKRGAQLDLLQSQFQASLAATLADPSQEGIDATLALAQQLQALGGDLFTGTGLSAFLGDLTSQLAQLLELEPPEAEIPPVQAILDTVNQYLPGIARTEDITDLDFSEITALIDQADLQALIDGLGAPEFAALIESIGALPLSELVNALGAQTIVDLTAALGAQVFSDLANELGALAVADLVLEFGVDAIADLVKAASSFDFSTMNFSEIVAALNTIDPTGELAAIATAIGVNGLNILFGLNLVATAMIDLGTIIANIPITPPPGSPTTPTAQAGALVKQDSLIFVHAGERILSPEATAAFEQQQTALALISRSPSPSFGGSSGADPSVLRDLAGAIRERSAADLAKGMELVAALSENTEATTLLSDRSRDNTEGLAEVTASLEEVRKLLDERPVASDGATT